MRKVFAQIFLLFIVLNFALMLQTAFADNAITGQLKSIGEQAGLTNPDTRLHPDAVPNYVQSGVGTATSPIYYVLDIARYVASTIAFIVVIIAALRLVGEGTDEEATAAKKQILYGIIGLLLIQLADVAVKQMFFGSQGEAFQSKADVQTFAENTVSQLRGIIGFVEVFVAAFAVFTIVIRGFVVISSAGDEEAISAAKRHVLYGAAGLITMGISELVIRGFVFPSEGEQLPKIEVAKRIIADLTNYLSGFIALLAFLSMFYAGYLYVSGVTNEDNIEKAKKIILGALLALLLALGAFGITNTFVQFDNPATTNSQVSLP